MAPRLSGYSACGIALGPSGLGAMKAEWLSASHPFVDIALGPILYEPGRRLDLAWLRHDRALIAAEPLALLLRLAPYARGHRA